MAAPQTRSAGEPESTPGSSFSPEPPEPKRGFWKWGLLLFGLVLLATGLYWGLHGRKPNLPQYQTTPIQRGSLTAKITATGTVSALVTVQVGSQVSGRVLQINVDFNSPVKKGQLIAKIDPQLFQATVEQARANFLAAKGNLAKAQAQALEARRQFGRNKALMDRKLIAQAELDTSEANAQAADAQVQASQGALEQTRAALHQAEVNFAYTNIISPTDGVVISRTVDVGQTVAASLQAPVLFTIAQDLRKMQVDTSVAEADVGKLQPGMDATFRVDAFPSELFKGKIRQIRNAAQTVQNVVTYDAVIDVDNPDMKLRPGMTANVTVVYAQANDVLRLPNAALRYRPPSEAAVKPAHPQTSKNTANPSDKKSIWVLRNGQSERVTVQLGVTDGSMTEIVSGDIKEGDEVITDVSGTGAPDKPKSQPSGSFRRMF